MHNGKKVKSRGERNGCWESKSGSGIKNPNLINKE